MERLVWLIVGPLAFLAMVFAFWPFVADDAYIVGRYALNAADGHGLVYNVGERISALTSPLHALFITLLAFFSADPVTLGRTLMVAAPLIAWASVLRIVQLSPFQIGVFTAFALMSPFLALWTVGGLESPLLALWLTLFVATLVRVWQLDQFDAATGVVLGALAGLAFLTRHDSLFLTMPPLLVLAASFPRHRGVWMGAVTALAVAGVWLVPAYMYYGDLLPTSFYIKTGLAGAPPIDSLTGTLNFFVVSGVVLILPFLRPSGGSGTLARALRLGLILSLAALSFWALKTSGKHMMFGYRFFVPYLLPLGLVLVVMLPKAPKRALRALPYGVATVSLAAAAFVGTRGMNPQPMIFAGLPELELREVTPADYAHFMETLRIDAEVLTRHAANWTNGNRPTIFLYTGGTGYWMRDFYVFETLISYRHNCDPSAVDRLLAADYVQQMGVVPVNPHFEQIVHARHPDSPPQHLGESQLYFVEETYIRYLIDPPITDFVLPSRIDGACGTTQLAAAQISD